MSARGADGNEHLIADRPALPPLPNAAAMDGPGQGRSQTGSALGVVLSDVSARAVDRGVEDLAKGRHVTHFGRPRAAARFAHRARAQRPEPDPAGCRRGRPRPRVWWGCRRPGGRRERAGGARSLGPERRGHGRDRAFTPDQPAGRCRDGVGQRGRRHADGTAGRPPGGADVVGAPPLRGAQGRYLDRGRAGGVGGDDPRREGSGGPATSTGLDGARARRPDLRVPVRPHAELHDAVPHRGGPRGVAGDPPA